MIEKVVNDIIAYKKSVAVMAAIRINLFQIISEKKIINLSICNEKGWNPDYLFLLLEYLSEIGYLKSHNSKKWSLVDEFETQVKQLTQYLKLVKHESNIFNNYVSPEIVIKCIESSNGKRPFDLKGFVNDNQMDYERAMYENSSVYIGLQLLRRLRSKAKYKVVEYGRTKELYKDLFLKKGIIYKNTDKLVDLAETYDAVIITNTIHYYSKDELNVVLRHIYNCLNEGGFLCVTDLFVDIDSSLAKSFYIDWLTHGGVYHSHLESVLERLKEQCYKTIEYKFLDNISTYFIVAYR